MLNFIDTSFSQNPIYTFILKIVVAELGNTCYISASTYYSNKFHDQTQKTANSKNVDNITIKETFKI